MTNVIKFPVNFKRPNLTPRKRVHYLGYRYAGSMSCQNSQNIFLKRHGAKNDERLWSIIVYSGCIENNRKRYPIELDCCLENEVPRMINKLNLKDEVTFGELGAMGWDGEVEYTANIKHISHPIYDNIKIPSFARPLNRHQLSISTMAQSVVITEFLAGKGLYAYTKHRETHCGFIWMNLEKYGSRETKTVPVKLVKQLSYGFLIRNLKKRSSHEVEA